MHKLLDGIVLEIPRVIHKRAQRMQKTLNSLTTITVINLDIKKLTLRLEILVKRNIKFGDNFIKIMQEIISTVQVHTWEI